MNNQGFQCNADLVLCIDGTGSMGPCIDSVKETALSFYDRLVAALEDHGRYVDQFRVKVIVFRDYYVDGDEAMKESRFFNLPAEAHEFSSFVNGIKVDGGGDEPENALEAIALAMNSDWVMDGTRRRHIVMVWTDASAHPLEKASEGAPSIYPKDIPNSLVGLSDWWNSPQGGKMNSSAKRLILFAPDAQPWGDLSLWDNTVFVPSQAGKGMEDIDMQIVLDTLAGSI